MEERQWAAEFGGLPGMEGEGGYVELAIFNIQYFLHMFEPTSRP